MRKNTYLRPRSSRYRLHLPCQVVRLRDFRLVADEIEDLSLGGILVGPSDPILTGEQLFVSFRLPSTGRWIDTEAHVARVVHGRRDGDQTRKLGIEFPRLTQEEERAIRSQLQTCPPVSPAARPGRRDPKIALQSFRMGSGWTRSNEGHALVRWSLW